MIFKILTKLGGRFMKESFEITLQKFLSITQTKIKYKFSYIFLNLPIPTLETEEVKIKEKKLINPYIKVISRGLIGKTAFVFIDKKTGDIYRAKSMKQRTKKACANIFDSDYGTSLINMRGNHCEIENKR
jgi:hypothetical protein